MRYGSKAEVATPEQSSAVTALLLAWRRGDGVAGEKLLRRVYADLRRRAAAYLRRERPDQTLQPTALVHEAYLRLIGQDRVSWQNRAQFFGVAAQMMRRILVDHARVHVAAKRGAGCKVELHEHAGASDPVACEILLLHDALTELASLHPLHGRIVELRYFGGLTEPEVAELLDVSRSTVTREWRVARAWLYRRITEGSAAHES
jgi:RNA polymerase sigma factor (TIGR02999 family)